MSTIITEFAGKDFTGEQVLDIAKRASMKFNVDLISISYEEVSMSTLLLFKEGSDFDSMVEVSSLIDGVLIGFNDFNTLEFLDVQLDIDAEYCPNAVIAANRELFKAMVSEGGGRIIECK